MKNKLVCILLAISCITALFTGCSQLQTLLNLIPGSDHIAEGTFTARVIRSAPLFESASRAGEPTTYLYEGMEVTPDGIEIVGDTVWIFCNTESGSGWTELSYLFFDGTDHTGTLPVRAPEQGVQVYFCPNGIRWTVTDGYAWLDISNICFYKGQYWGFAKDIGYICMDDVTLSENVTLPERTETDTAVEPINLIGTWYCVIDSYISGAQGTEETWEFNEDGTFRVFTDVYLDSLTVSSFRELRGGFWWQDGEILSLSYCEMNSDDTPSDRPVDQVYEYLLMQGQDGPVICGETRVGLSSTQTYGENYQEFPDAESESSKPETSKPEASRPESSKAESSKPTESKPANGVSYEPMDGMLGTWHTFHGDYCRIWTFVMGDSSFKVDGQIPFRAEYQEGKLDKNGNLTDISEHMVFDYGYFKNSKMYLVCGPDEYGPYDVRLEHGNLYIKADGYQLGYDYLVCYDSGWPSKPEQEESEPADDISYALPSILYGKFVSVNASGDGEDTLRESWTFGKGDGSFKVDGNIPFWAEYRAEMLDSGGEVVEVVDRKYFDYGYFRNGDLYLVCGSDEYGPYFIEGYNNSILIKAYQYMGSPVERYYDRL